MQSSLFDEPAALPNGLAFVPEFLSPEEERALLAGIEAWSPPRRCATRSRSGRE